MDWVALAVYLLGVALAFGLRTWQQIRTTGTSGYRGVSGRPGSVSWWGGILFPVALVLGLAGPVLALTGTTRHVAPLSHAVVAGCGLVLGVAGLVLVLLAQRSMGDSWRIGVDDTERTELVTTGMFRWMRNPVFTGMAAVVTGVALMAPTAISLLALVTLVVAVQIQVRAVEEPYLRRVHGEQYLRYAAQAGRFLPAIGKIAARVT
ncbi:methyltransferase family protein [Pseudonocardia sichuanensis]